MTPKLYTENHNAKKLCVKIPIMVYLNGNTRRYIELTLAHSKQN